MGTYDTTHCCCECQMKKETKTKRQFNDQREKNCILDCGERKRLFVVFHHKLSSVLNSRFMRQQSGNPRQGTKCNAEQPATLCDCVVLLSRSRCHSHCHSRCCTLFVIQSTWTAAQPTYLTEINPDKKMYCIQVIQMVLGSCFPALTHAV